MATQTLTGIKVVDLPRVLTGPYCIMMLGDMGPPFIDGESAYYLSINRNKRSLTLNLKSNEGREIIHKLLADADVVVEDFAPGATKYLGLDYESVRKIKPDVVYTSISGLRQNEPRNTGARSACGRGIALRSRRHARNYR